MAIFINPDVAFPRKDWHWVAFMYPFDSYMQDRYMERWIINNLAGPYTAHWLHGGTQHRFGFRDPNDAMAFKLMWVQ